MRPSLRERLNEVLMEAAQQEGIIVREVYVTWIMAQAYSDETAQGVGISQLDIRADMVKPR